MFLSKFEISDVDLEMHAQMAGVERMLGSKAVLAVRVSTPVGQLYLMNLHTTAGGGLSPEAVDAVRESELQEAVDMGTAALGEGYIPIILGDMNMGPVVSKPNYDFVMSQGYFDAVTQCVTEEQQPLMTWDPANPLNAVGPHKDCPPQWVDHFFVHDTSGLEGVEAAIVLTGQFCTRQTAAASMPTGASVHAPRPPPPPGGARRALSFNPHPLLHTHPGTQSPSWSCQRRRMPPRR